MSWVAVAVGGGALVGAYMQSQSAQNAADTQASAARGATAAQLSMYNQTRTDQAPMREAGNRALSQMENPEFQRNFSMTDFQADPGYAFRIAEGQKAIARASAAKGLFSSGTLKSLSRYNQDMGSQEYQNAYGRFTNDQTNRFNRLASIAGTGQTASNQVAAAGQNTANQIGQNMTGAGNAQAAGQIGSSNAYANAIGSGTNSWMQYQMMNRLMPQQTTAIPTANGAGGSYGSFSNIA